MDSEFLSSKQIILRIVTIISLVEFTIMNGFIFFNAIEMGPYIEAMVDILLLALFATPLIYAWVISPYVSARDEMLETLNCMVHADTLTGLPNRRDIYAHLTKAIATSVRHDCEGVVILLGLDDFKHINEQFGREAGDAVLIETGERLLARTRTEDIAGRLDGDEFVVIINHLDSDRDIAHAYAVKLAEQLIAAVSEPVMFQGHELQPGASVGIKFFGCDEVNSESATHDASVALARAKQAGKGRAVMFENQGPSA